nr:WRKY24 [Phoebe bournei]
MLGFSHFTASTTYKTPRVREEWIGQALDVVFLGADSRRIVLELNSDKKFKLIIMAGISDCALPPNFSPRTTLLSLLGEGANSRSLQDLPGENEVDGPSNQKMESKSDDDEVGSRNSGECSWELGGAFSGQKSNSRGGLAERMAARAGFNAPRLNTARIRSSNIIPSSSPEVRSPYLTIPPGLSPTSLLESPVFISNSLAQLSPTTGKFPIAQCNNRSSMQISASPDKDKDLLFKDSDSESFVFKHHVEMSSSYFPSVANKVASVTNHHQSFLELRGNITSDAKPSQPSDDREEGEGDQRELLSTVAAGALSEDGYNWRKYGQKQVKEIIYKGAHNHPKPPPNRRSVIGSSYPPGEMDGAEQSSAHIGFDGEPARASSQHGVGTAGSNWRHDDMETASAATEFYDPSTNALVQDGPHFEMVDAIDVSSTMSNNEDEDDQGTHGSVSLGHDDEGDESESKRRKVDASLMEMTGATRAIREPRVVVQTTSEVDILDDGYRWRKYGQKVVKGNPNPRSYYKCTNPGCTVRKHVERASHDLKSVITTYEGKHNHDVPAARSSSHISNGPSGVTSTAAVQTLIPRSEPSKAHDSWRDSMGLHLSTHLAFQVGSLCNPIPGSLLGTISLA